MSSYHYLVLNILFYILLVITPQSSYAELVYGETNAQLNCPVEKNKAPKSKSKVKKKRKKKFFKKPDKTEDVRTSLYITVALMLMLPLFVIIGISLVYFGYTLLPFLITGIGLIALGNGAAIAGGATAGSNRFYGTQVLSFALWVFFGIDLVGSIVLGILAFTVFAAVPFLWILALALLVLAIFMLIWVLIIRKQNKGLRNSSKEEELE